MIQNRMKKIREIQHSVEMKRRNIDKEKSASVKLFTDLIRSFERCQSELLKMMEEQQKAAEKQAEDLIKELQQEITDLKKRNTELEQLSHTDDHLCLLQMFSSLYSLQHTNNWTTISIDSDVNVFPLHRALTQMKKTHETLNEQLCQTGLRWARKYAVDVTLDPDTANPYLILSDDGKQVSLGDIEHDVRNTPKRFNVCNCVLAKQGFSSGRFYYEVQVKGKTEWDLGVARESINRKVTNILTPVNGFWTVALINENEYLVCDDPVVAFPQRKTPEKVGVFVDYEEGVVSFYDVGSSSHIYSFTGQTFTEKLYPYLSPCFNDEETAASCQPPLHGASTAAAEPESDRITEPIIAPELGLESVTDQVYEPATPCVVGLLVEIEGMEESTAHTPVTEGELHLVSGNYMEELMDVFQMDLIDWFGEVIPNSPVSPLVPPSPESPASPLVPPSPESPVSLLVPTSPDPPVFPPNLPLPPSSRPVSSSAHLRWFRPALNLLYLRWFRPALILLCSLPASS
ncbi:hypothetical protein cypCar_00041706 [Cyprinus carpio]|nr:hypothetical protein cypCar_00041706 [Cyprinus carpio]